MTTEEVVKVEEGEGRAGERKGGVMCLILEKKLHHFYKSRKERENKVIESGRSKKRY